MSVSLGDKAELQGRGGLSRAAAPRAAEPRKGTVLVEGLNIVQHLSRLNPGEKSLRRGFLSQKFTNAKLNNRILYTFLRCADRGGGSQPGPRWLHVLSLALYEQYHGDEWILIDGADQDWDFPKL